MKMKWILDDAGNPIEEPDVLKWAVWFETHGKEKIVQHDNLPGGILVSTVFLGINHNWGSGPPILWETMIFGGKWDKEEYQERYHTKEEALEGHTMALALAKGSED